MAAAMGSIGTVTVAPLAVAAILLGLSSEGSATATKVALIKETMAALDIVIFSNSYRPYGFLIGIYPIWHHFDDVGLAADGELFISCNECAFLVCWTCYEYERREGSQVCPQMQTRFKHHKGCALAGRSYEDIQYMAEAMLQGHMSYGRGLMSICLKLFTQCLKSLCSPMARWLMIFLRNSTLSSLPSWVGEERGFTHFPLRIAVFQQISSLAESVRTRNMTGRGFAGYIDGCTMALVTWAVEHANSLLRKHRLSFIYPHLLRWNNAPFPRKVEAIIEAIKKLKKFEVIQRI